MSALARRKEGNGEETYVGESPPLLRMKHQLVVRLLGCWPGWVGREQGRPECFSGEGAGAFGAGGEMIAINAMRMLARTPTMANSAYEE